jgi:dTDP-4-amino-4,6-dideoxygalactose transaminase
MSASASNLWDPWFQGKDFTSDWSSTRFSTWVSVLAGFVDSDVKVLEIGSWEGRSAIFFLEYLPRSRITCIDTFEGSPLLRTIPRWSGEIAHSQRRFDSNLLPYGDRVEKIHACSLPALFSLSQSGRRFDVIYIDGSHDRDDVLMDSILSWRLLNPNGILIWDDYIHPGPRPPRVAIDAFLTMNAGEFVELHRGRQLIVCKRSDPERCKGAPLESASTTKMRFSQPVIVGREHDYLRQAMEQRHLSSDGPFTRRCETWLATRLNAPCAHLTHSATAALELSALLATLGPGDEVVMPAFTFVSCANAVALRGATPVFVEIRADTLNLDPRAVKEAITDRTRAIVAVHYAGVPCDMAAIAALAEQHGLVVIEDAAQALLSSYRGELAGTLGHLGVVSFHDTKNIIAGEGGAIIVNDTRLAGRASVVRQKGTDREEFLRGERARYSWVDLGSSFAPSELNAAVLLAQLEQAEEITRRRRALWARYHRAFAALEAAGAVRRPIVPDEVVHNGHLYYLLLPGEAERDRFIAAMKSRGIATPFHFVPLDDSPGGRRFARAHGDLSITHSVAGRLVRLPLWFGMEGDQDRVIDATHSALREIAVT